MIKGLIFDNDGVIVDSEPLHHLAEKKTMAPYGVDITKEEYTNYVGVGTRKMFADWIQKYHLPLKPENIIPYHDQNLIAIFQDLVEPTPGVVDFIKYLFQKKYPLAVASSSHRNLVHIGIKKHSLMQYFQTIITGDDVTRVKPEPDIFLLAATRLKISPTECLVIEDSSVGVQAAKAAGMFCAGYQNENSGAQDLSKADIIFQNFSELMQIGNQFAL
jgi:HAD superfamily hydrolase (TIGR01509 family)